MSNKTKTLFIALFMVSYGANSGVAILYDSLGKTVPNLLDVGDKRMLGGGANLPIFKNRR